MRTRFVVHRHKTARPHYDLRLVCDGTLRSWSMAKEPPAVAGERRLAVERESHPAEKIESTSFEEEAYGAGRVWTWDAGAVEIDQSGPGRLILQFHGERLLGRYRLEQTEWYPGNRWLLAREGARENAGSSPSSAGAHPRVPRGKRP